MDGGSVQPEHPPCESRVMLGEATAQGQLVVENISNQNTLMEAQVHPSSGSLGAYRVFLLLGHLTQANLCAFSDHTGPKFDIDMLVSLLRQENARDICVIQVPPEMKYADYFVIASGTSTRHLHAVVYYIVKMVGCFLTLWHR